MPMFLNFTSAVLIKKAPCSSNLLASDSRDKFTSGS